MYDANYFLEGLRKQVAAMGGQAVVCMVLHSRGTFYLRDVVETHPGYVLLNVWHDGKGSPIRAPSSDTYSHEIPAGYHPISVSFESISIIDVMPTTVDEGHRIGFQMDASIKKTHS